VPEPAIIDLDPTGKVAISSSNKESNVGGGIGEVDISAKGKTDSSKTT
jgi:hypothetical protein